MTTRPVLETVRTEQLGRAMARQEFYDDLRRVYGLAFPTEVETAAPLVNPDEMRRKLRGSPFWLAPKSVEAYHPEDFNDLDAGRQEELKRAVDTFGSIAKVVTRNAPLTEDQLREGLRAFATLLSIVRPLILQEWVAEVVRRVAEAEEWCASKEWLARRKSKSLKDKFLGSYDAPQLHVSAFDNHFLLAPVARFAPGTSGLLDLALLPSYDSVLVVHSAGQWRIDPVEADTRRRPWSKAAFIDTVTQLISRV
jgi:hypothetical protein